MIWFKIIIFLAIIILYWKIFVKDREAFGGYVILTCIASWIWGIRGYIVVTLLVSLCLIPKKYVDAYDNATEYFSEGDYSAALESIDIAINRLKYKAYVKDEFIEHLSLKAKCCKHLCEWQQVYEICGLLLELTSNDTDAVIYEEERKEYLRYREEACEEMKMEKYINNLNNEE